MCHKSCSLHLDLAGRRHVWQVLASGLQDMPIDGEISLQAAVTISAKNPSLQLLWDLARQGSWFCSSLHPSEGLEDGGRSRTKTVDSEVHKLQHLSASDGAESRRSFHIHSLRVRFESGETRRHSCILRAGQDRTRQDRAVYSYSSPVFSCTSRCFRHHLASTAS